MTSVMALSSALLVMFVTVARAQNEVIDRVLAVVAGEIITQSDVDGVVALGLVQTDGAQDRRGAALQRLIERELMLREVRRYLPPEPAAAAVEQRLQAIRGRFPSGDALAQTLAASGMDEARLHEIVREDLRIQAYLDERFGGLEPTEEELATYYKQHLADFTRLGQAPPLSDVRAAVRQSFETGRREKLVADWLADLRRRTEITELAR